MVMEMHGNPYLPGEEQAADAMAVTFLNEGEPASCRTLPSLLEERLGSPDEAARAMASRAPGLRRPDRGAYRAVSWFYVASQSGHAGVSH
jgi:hypothetical protein